MGSPTKVPGQPHDIFSGLPGEYPAVIGVFAQELCIRFLSSGSQY
jgi:hypothetical protein